MTKNAGLMYITCTQYPVQCTLSTTIKYARKSSQIVCFGVNEFRSMCFCLLWTEHFIPLLHTNKFMLGGICKNTALFRGNEVLQTFLHIPTSFTSASCFPDKYWNQALYEISGTLQERFFIRPRTAFIQTKQHGCILQFSINFVYKSCKNANTTDTIYFHHMFCYLFASQTIIYGNFQVWLRRNALNEVMDSNLPRIDLFALQPASSINKKSLIWEHAHWID